MHRILYQFPPSHYCEKARWMLDYKRLDYTVRNVVPGQHRLLAWWHAHSATVPLLKDGREWVGDSTEMAFYLDARYARYPLFPQDPLQRSRVAMLEEMADEAGEHVRHWFYAQTLDTPEMASALLGDHAWLNPYRKYAWPVIRETIRNLYAITPESHPLALQQIYDAMNRFERILMANGGRYLAGDCLSVADIATASLFAPLLGLPGTPWAVFTSRNPVFAQVHEDSHIRPLGQWIRRLYAEERVFR